MGAVTISLNTGGREVRRREQLEAISTKHNIYIPYNLHFDRWPEGYCGHPFMVRVDGRLAGFALIKQIPDDHVDFDVGEFFIVRRFRGRGVGKTVAQRLFDRFPGRWEVRQMLGHGPAQTFWRRVIADYSGDQYDESTQHIEQYGIDMVVQRFVSGASD